MEAVLRANMQPDIARANAEQAKRKVYEESEAGKQPQKQFGRKH